MHGKHCFHKWELSYSPKQSNQPFLLTGLHFNPLLTGLIADLEFITILLPFYSNQSSRFHRGTGGLIVLVKNYGDNAENQPKGGIPG